MLLAFGIVLIFFIYSLINILKCKFFKSKLTKVFRIVQEGSFTLILLLICLFYFDSELQFFSTEVKYYLTISFGILLVLNILLEMIVFGKDAFQALFKKKKIAKPNFQHSRISGNSNEEVGVNNKLEIKEEGAGNKIHPKDLSMKSMKKRKINIKSRKYIKSSDKKSRFEIKTGKNKNPFKPNLSLLSKAGGTSRLTSTKNLLLSEESNGTKIVPNANLNSIRKISQIKSVRSFKIRSKKFGKKIKSSRMIINSQ